MGTKTNAKHCSILSAGGTNNSQNPSISLPCNALPRDQSFCIAASEGRMTVEVPVTEGPTVTVTGGPTVTVTGAGTTVTVVSGTTVTFSTGTTLTVSAVSTVVVSGITVPVTVPVSVPIPIIVTATVTATVTAPTPRRGNNGVSTPLPYQQGMVENCKTFYYVQQGETCDTIAARFHIVEAQIVAWNPSAKSDCTNLSADNYACVGTA